LAVGAGGVSALGVGPGALVGVGGFFEASVTRTTVRVGLQYAYSRSDTLPSGASALFTWTVATVDACVLRWDVAQFTLLPCLRVDAGALAGSGRDVSVAADDTRFWMDGGVIARGQWFFWGPLFLDLEAGGVISFTRPRFHFDNPDVTVHQPSVVGGIAALHLGARFP
jgi:hypothetical protein